MSSKIRKLIKYTALTFIILGVYIVVTILFNYNIGNKIKVSINVLASNSDIYQVFYKYTSSDWSEINSKTEAYTQANEIQNLQFTIPSNIEAIRIDLGTHLDNISLSKIIISKGFIKKDITSSINLDKIELHNISDVRLLDGSLLMTTINDDPGFIIFTQDLDYKWVTSMDHTTTILIKVAVCALYSLVLGLAYRKRKRISEDIHTVISNRRLIWSLSKNDFKTKYAGSYLGIIWAFVQPVVIVAIYWFVFQVGFRASTVNDFPFVLWLVSGMVPWFFFSDAVANAANCMLEYNYLVKQVVFKIEVLPIVKMISALFVHCFFIIFTIIIFYAYGYIPNIYHIQIMYYMICSFALILGISYANCAILIFFRDLVQIIAIFLQIAMWMTPILWQDTILTGKFHLLADLNPIYYIVSGFRDCFIDGKWFWEKASATTYFWLITLAFLAIGTTVFRRLKPHFADVL